MYYLTVLELQDQGVREAGFFWGLSGKHLFQAFLGGLQMAVFSPCLYKIIPGSVCFCVQISPFYKDTSHIGLGPTLMTSL